MLSEENKLLDSPNRLSIKEALKARSSDIVSNKITIISSIVPDFKLLVPGADQTNSQV